MDAKTAAAIAADIQARISAGTYAHGEALPAAGQLAESYGVSRPTVVSALARLALLGLIKIGSGKPAEVIAGPATTSHLGTYGPPDLSAAPSRTAVGDGTGEARTTQVRHIQAEGIPGLDDGTSIVERTRIYYVDGIPAQHKWTIFPTWVAERKPEGWEGTAPMMAPPGDTTPLPSSRFYDWAGIGAVTKHSTITVEPMLPAAAEALGLPEETPGFRSTTITRDTAGRTVDVLIQTVPLHHKLTITAS